MKTTSINTTQSEIRLKVGDRASIKRTITKKDILLIAELIGDYNPVHMDDHFAAQTRFKGRIAHGELITGLISALIGNVLPGPGTIYLSQNIRFLKPVRPDDTIASTVEVMNITQEKRIVQLHATCHNQHDQIILEGEYTVLIEDINNY